MNPELWLANKTAVVTGAGNGIGRAMAELFALQGVVMPLCGTRKA